VAKYYFDDNISDSEKESMFKFYTSDICQNFQPYYSARLERNVSAFEMYHLTRIIYSEAGNQEFRGKVAVAATVLNRLEDTSGLFENRIYDVIFQPEQFSSADIVDAERNTAGKYFSCGDELKYAQLDPGVEAECLNAAKVALDGEDPTRDYTTGAGALFFYNPKYCNENELSLRANIDDFVIIGDHWFYRNW
jgi:spore germination cell wall hydrolase CwlJ-like protein